MAGLNVAGWGKKYAKENRDGGWPGKQPGYQRCQLCGSKTAALARVAGSHPIHNLRCWGRLDFVDRPLIRPIRVLWSQIWPRRWRSQGELRLDGRRPPGGLDGGNGAAEEEKRDPLPPRSRVSRTEWKLTEFLRTVWKQRVNVSHSGNLRSTDGSGERVERCRGLQDALEQACICKGRGHKIS